MAVTADVVLGSATPSGTLTSTTLVTSAAAASGSKGVFSVGWFNAVTLTSVSDGTNTYRISGQLNNSNNCSAIVEVDFPSGLPNGTTITFNFSGAGAQVIEIYGRSVSGAASGAAASFDSQSQTTATWTASAAGKAGNSGDYIFGTSKEGSGADNNQTSANAGYTEVFDHVGNPAGTGNAACANEQFASSGGTFIVGGTWSGSSTCSSCQVVISQGVIAATGPTPPLPRAFQEQGRIYSGEQTGFQPLAFQIPDPGRAFQEGTRFGEQKAFQDQAFQKPDPSVAFQPEAFDDVSAFQMSVVAFQEPTGFQGDAFQEFTGLERRTPRTVVVSTQKKNQRGFLIARGHRQARIIRAPQPPPAVATAPKLSIYSTLDRRPARLARARRRKPLVLRAPLTAQRPVAALVSKRVVKGKRPLIRRRKPLVLRSPQVSLAPRGPILERQSLTRSRLVRKVRRGRAIILRGVSTPTAPPVTGIPVKRVFVAMDRRAAFVRARVRRKQVLRAPSVPTPVPWIRNHVYVAHRARSPLVARLRRRKLQIERSTVFAVRPPTAIIRKQRRRIQQKRKRAIVLRSVPIWQRPRTPIITGQHRKATILARARHRLRLIISKNLGPPPPPSTASFFGQAFLSDVAVYNIGLDDLELYGLALKDGVLYDISLDDRANYDTSLNDSAVYETNLSDIPGG